MRLSIAISLSLFAALVSAQTLDPKTTEIAGPPPAIVKPAVEPGQPPADALVLFDGRSLDQWRSVDEEKPPWRIADGAVTDVPGAANLVTRRAFADVQLHLEWRTPLPTVHAQNLATEQAATLRSHVEERLGMHQFMANSGVFLQQRYEIQVLETYGAETYVNGQAGAVYKQHIPLVNAARPPGEWQTYDIVYRAPRFSEKGTLLDPARMTVFHNGVLIQNHVALWGPTEFLGAPRYEAHGPAPIELQSHAGVSQVSYRNIWVREL